MVVSTYAGTGRPLWLDCAPCCPPRRNRPLPRCPSSASWYEHDLCDGEEEVWRDEEEENLKCVHYNPGSVCGRQDGEDLEGGGGGGGVPVNKQEGNNSAEINHSWAAVQFIWQI